MKTKTEKREDFDMWDLAQTGPDPHSLYAEMRAECPVRHSSKYGGFNYTADHHTMTAVAAQPETFSSNPGVVPPMLLERPMIPLMIDPPEHRGYRRILNPFFTMERLNQLAVPLRDYAAQLCGEMALRGECDAVADYSGKIPIFTLSIFFKVPEELRPDFVAWALSMTQDVVSDPQKAMQSNISLAGALTELLVERREHPLDDDLLSDLASGNVGGRTISQQEAIDICLVMVAAGSETTQHGIANSLRVLAGRPDLRARLIAEPELFPSAIEEFLRYDGPVQFVARKATTATDVAGTHMEPGEDIVLLWASGNRDPAAFDNPDELIIDRKPNRHVAFGSGIHRCIGANLARVELRVALQEFLRHIPDFEVTENLDQPEDWSTGITRGPKHLGLRFSGAGAPNAKAE
jgi:cytochrome P450